MSESYIGCEVSVEVGGGLGFYQGRVVSVNTGRQTVTLTRVLHNGRPAALSEVTINAGDVVDLTILSRLGESKKIAAQPPKAEPRKNVQQQPVAQRLPQQPQALPQPQPQPQQVQPQHQPIQPHQFSQPPPPPQTQPQPQSQPQQLLDFSQPPPQTSYQKVARQGFINTCHDGGSSAEAVASSCEIQQPRRKPRTSVGETLAHGSHYQSPAYKEPTSNWQQPNPSSSAVFQDYSSPRRNDRYGFDLARTPGKKERMRRNRDETTFGDPIDDDMLTEFDFEKNLALFDKRAVIEEIQSLKPDVVRQADRHTEKKYRCDENVLPSKPPAKRQIIVPTSGAAEVIYANDSGLLVPSISSELRAALLSTANQHGLTNSRQLEIIGRAATELILSLSGGSHRLEPGNSHQPPIIVLLCGCHVQGAAGVNAARQLESHGVQTVVVTPQPTTSPPPPLLLTHELQLYALTNGRNTSDSRGLPSTIDLIVDARLDHSGKGGEGGVVTSWLTSTTTWASASRAPILALDPPSDLAALPSTHPPLPARVLLCPALPLAYTPARGKVYLLNIPIPQQTFNAVGIKYVSPFGAKLVVPLHPYE